MIVWNILETFVRSFVIKELLAGAEVDSSEAMFTGARMKSQEEKIC
jgi:hypothetical protein